MPRKPRYFLPNVPVHMMIRGNDRRQAVFAEDADYLAYLAWLHEASELYDIELHAYVLMTNHIHFLLRAG